MNIARYGTMATALIAIGTVAAFSWGYVIGDSPPLVGRAALTTVQFQFQQNLDGIKKQNQEFQAQLQRNGDIQRSLALTVYKQQLDQAQAQINLAARQGRRDLSAEALRNYAEQAIMQLTGAPQGR